MPGKKKIFFFAKMVMEWKLKILIMAVKLILSSLLQVSILADLKLDWRALKLEHNVPHIRTVLQTKMELLPNVLVLTRAISLYVESYMKMLSLQTIYKQ